MHVMMTGWRCSTTVLLLTVLCSGVAESKLVASGPPTLPELQRFPVKNGFENIVAEIQNDYESFGIRLLDDSNGLRIKGIEKTKCGNPIDITIEIVRQWLQGKGRKPVTWQTFVECLRESMLDVLADHIEAALGRSNVPPTPPQQQQQPPSIWSYSTVGLLVVLVLGILVLVVIFFKELQHTSPSENTASPESSDSTTGINKGLSISVEEDADTIEVKHNLSDPETPENERKDVFGEVIKPSVEDTVQLHSKVSGRTTPSGKTTASARSKQNATKVLKPPSYGTWEKAAVPSSSTKPRGLQEKVALPSTSMKSRGPQEKVAKPFTCTTSKGAQNPLYSMQKSPSSDQTTKRSPKARHSTATGKKPPFEGMLKPELKNVKILRKIGEGAFGYVEKVQYKGKIYAGKRFRADRSFDNKRFCREFENLQGLSHCHIVKYYGYHIVHSRENKSPMLIMEYMVTNVHDVLISPTHQDLPFSRKVVWLHGIAQGLEYLHRQSVIHRDLTATNILFDGKAFPKISDFGNSCVIGDDLGSDYYSQNLTSCPGTLSYLAPEAQTKNYGKEIDIFSFGHLSLFIATQKPSFRLLPATFSDPHTGLLQPHDEVQRREEHFSYLYKKLQKSHPLVTVMKECLAISPERRPEASELVSRLGTMSSKLSPPPPFCLN